MMILKNDDRTISTGQKIGRLMVKGNSADAILDAGNVSSHINTLFWILWKLDLAEPKDRQQWAHKIREILYDMDNYFKLVKNSRKEPRKSRKKRERKERQEAIDQAKGTGSQTLGEPDKTQAKSQGSHVSSDSKRPQQ